MDIPQFDISQDRFMNGLLNKFVNYFATIDRKYVVDYDV